MTIEWCPTCGGPLRPRWSWWASWHDDRVVDGCRLCWLVEWEEDCRRLVRGAEWRGREAEANSDPNDQAGTGGSFSQWLPPGMRWGIRSFAPTQDAALNMWLDHADRFTRGAPPYGDREAA